MPRLLISPSVRMVQHLYAFTGIHIGREFIAKLYRETLKLEGKHSLLGWRSAFSTLARDQGFERDVMEPVIDHAHDNEVPRAYHRDERLTRQAGFFNWWGEQLTVAQRAAKILSLL